MSYAVKATIFLLWAVVVMPTLAVTGSFQVLGPILSGLVVLTGPLLVIGIEFLQRRNGSRKR